ncbi:MAG: tetrapyrrole methylase family protein / MazG family protein [Clostridiales bacterium]|jgi:tetrapyrrole methylase family protein/MazG family protein|nr:tetrapyrrole methylase family protein / MazG family protein [Clostridiales bacterium]
MYTLTIVGMGPGGADYLTMEAYRVLTTGEMVFLRTDRHPIVEMLTKAGMTYTSFDDVYESASDFDGAYKTMANRVLEAAQNANVVYAVPGNPFVAEKSVALILEKAESASVGVHIVHGASFIDAIVTTLKYDPVNGLVIADALGLSEANIHPDSDYLWIQVYNQHIASELKLALMADYEDDQNICIIQAAGVPELECIKWCKLYEMDRHSEDFDHLTSVFVPKPEARAYGMADLVHIMRRLRGEGGCPWDREQTHESLTPYLVEEAYEVRHAVFHEDDAALADELGDVLLQVVFHAAIGEEEGYFGLPDVYKAVCEKMIRRHPHVFGDVHVQNSDEVLDNWQAIKNTEKSISRVIDTMRTVSSSFPALLRAQKVQKKAASVGFDWGDAEVALDKVEEEVAELREAIQLKDAAAIAEELGDLLLIAANVARLAKVDAELALNDATEKFMKRFEYIETAFIEQGKTLEASELVEMERLWQEAKKWEKI